MNLIGQTIDWTALFSVVGISYIASWLLFFALAPLFNWFLGNWKLASGVAYAVSWLAMLAFLRLYWLYIENPNQTKK